MSEFKRVKNLISLEEYANSKLKISHGKFVCPFCSSGGHVGTDSDSAFFVYSNSQQFHCFSCGAHGDVFDLIAQVGDIPKTRKVEQLEAAKKWLGETPKANLSKTQDQRQRNCIESKGADGTAVGKGNATRYIERSRAHIAKCASYLAKRGFSVDFAIEHGLGFDISRQMLLIPYPGNEHYFIGRSIDPNAKARYLKPRAVDVGSEPVFNETALDGKWAIATEGQIDCLSCLSLGFNSLAVSGASNWKKVIASMEKRLNKPTILILFDRDPAGIKASRAFANALREKGIRHGIICPPQNLRGKDPNEWLVNNKESFSLFLSSSVAAIGGHNER